MAASSKRAGWPPAPGAGGKLILGGLLLVLVVWLGRAFGHHLPVLEQWIASQGVGGWIVFVLVVMVCTSLFVPDTLFAVMAGMLFGIFGGTVLISISALLTASVNFLISRRLLHQTVRRWLERQPRLAALERAVNQEGLRFQFLLRLTPLHPVSVSYALGATNTRFPTFLTACLGLIPGLFVEVYFGYVAKHVASVAHNPAAHSHLHTAFTLAGLVACLSVFVYVTHLARRALAEAEPGMNLEK